MVPSFSLLSSSSFSTSVIIFSPPDTVRLKRFFFFFLKACLITANETFSCDLWNRVGSPYCIFCLKLR